MADTKISDMTAAGTLSGSELIPGVQSAGNVKLTVDQVKAYVLAQINETIDDRVAALLVAGSNVTLTYNDASGTLTVSASGGTATTNTVAVVTHTGGNRDVLATDAGKVVRCTSDTAFSITAQSDGVQAVPVESVATYRQVGAGQITFAAAGGLTLNVPTGLQAKSRGQNSTVMLHKITSTVWDITGDLASA